MKSNVNKLTYAGYVLILIFRLGYIITLKTGNNHTKIKYYQQQLVTYKNDITAPKKTWDIIYGMSYNHHKMK